MEYAKTLYILSALQSNYFKHCISNRKSTWLRCKFFLRIIFPGKYYVFELTIFQSWNKSANQLGAILSGRITHLCIWRFKIYFLSSKFSYLHVDSKPNGYHSYSNHRIYYKSLKVSSCESQTALSPIKEVQSYISFLKAIH